MKLLSLLILLFVSSCMGHPKQETVKEPPAIPVLDSSAEYSAAGAPRLPPPCCLGRHSRETEKPKKTKGANMSTDEFLAFVKWLEKRNVLVVRYDRYAPIGDRHDDLTDKQLINLLEEYSNEPK